MLQDETPITDLTSKNSQNQLRNFFPMQALFHFPEISLQFARCEILSPFKAIATQCGQKISRCRRWFVDYESLEAKRPI
ncbi:MAG: hypothetical protein DWI22_18040 [Planctomycetota bacterium]|nr:MAG: hypothetical protein DWI22_18040 [Planctomycetota bacterium]